MKIRSLVVDGATLRRAKTCGNRTEVWSKRLLPEMPAPKNDDVMQESMTASSTDFSLRML
jgi:hypothetical protein